VSKPAINTTGTGVPPEGSDTETDGGDAAPPPPPETPKLFGQDEVNTLLAKNKKALQADLAKEREARAALEKKLEDVLNRFETAAPDPKAKTEEGRAEILEKRYQRQLAELEAKVKEQEARAQAEHQRRVDGERDRMLDEALVSVGCTDMKAGRRYFLPDITREDEDGNPADTWLLKTSSGKLIDIATGVMEALPKYLRNPSVNVGGSGTSGGGPKAKEKDAVKALEKELDGLKAQALAAGSKNGPILIKYEAKKRELQALKRTLTNKTA
jgi:hypothetical protein